MTRKLRALGIALCAVLVLGATAATAAEAAEFEGTADSTVTASAL